MLSAFASSTLFLISYLVYHYQVGSVPFKGQGGIRTRLFRYSSDAHDSGGGGCSAGTDHVDPGAQTKIRSPSTHRPLDLSHLALRFRDRSHRILDALSNIAISSGRETIAA